MISGRYSIACAIGSGQPGKPAGKYHDVFDLLRSEANETVGVDDLSGVSWFGTEIDDCATLRCGRSIPLDTARL
jgi:hypothetical protein